MPTRQVQYFAGVTAVVAMGLGMTQAAHAEKRQHTVVRPGGSVQEAVDAALPGDVIEIEPGVYRGSVLVDVPGLTIRGAGPKTVIMPAPGSTEAVRAPNACAAAGHGICVTGRENDRLTDVRVLELTVSGFERNGVWGSETDRMTVRGVSAENNGWHGIGQEKSTRAEFRGNSSRDNGETGVFLANTVDEEAGAIDTRGTVVSGNHVEGNRTGIVIRRARGLVVEKNDVQGNCGGVFVVGDESTPRGGALTVRANNVHDNNKYCAETARLPFIQGTGILLTGVEETLVTGNRVAGNVGESPLSGGIVLFRSVVGVPNTRNVISDNVLTDNGPADLADRDEGTDNIFTGNLCRVSLPAGRC